MSGLTQTLNQTLNPFSDLVVTYKKDLEQEFIAEIQDSIKHPITYNIRKLLTYTYDPLHDVDKEPTWKEFVSQLRRSFVLDKYPCHDQKR